MKNFGYAAVIFVISLSFLVSCGGTRKVKAEPAGEDVFFDKTRLIMLKSEREIYKHLPDQKARETFIKEFWEKRDPNPLTGENEAKREFERRIDYIERWFRERPGTRGWDSDRGKIFLLLGKPDERSTGEGNVYNRLGTRARVRKEYWYYQKHRLYLEFRDLYGYGEFQLANWSAELLAAIEEAKFAIFSEVENAQQFKFKATYKNGEVIIAIPVKHVTFDEKEGKMNAAFKITVYVYHDYRKKHRVEVTRSLSGGKEEFLKKKNIELAVPCGITGKGKFGLDIVVKDLSSNSSYRSFIKHKN